MLVKNLKKKECSVNDKLMQNNENERFFGCHVEVCSKKKEKGMHSISFPFLYLFNSVFKECFNIICL